MRIYVVMLCVGVWLFPPNGFAADLQVPPVVLDPREDAPGVARVYDTLLQKRLEDRQNTFTQLSSPQKSAVWAHHLLTALAEHPEFTAEQRAVVQYALSILTPTFAETDPADLQWDQAVGEPLRELERRASTVFTRQQMRSLFAQLGPEPVDASDAGTAPTENPDPSPSTARIARIAPLDVITVPQCHCSTSADFCDSSGVGFYYCRAGACWPTTSGCGWFWRSSCNGLCAVRQGGGGGD
jgi:hypothetical protein